MTLPLRSLQLTSDVAERTASSRVHLPRKRFGRQSAASSAGRRLLRECKVELEKRTINFSNKVPRSTSVGAWQNASITSLIEPIPPLSA